MTQQEFDQLVTNKMDEQHVTHAEALTLVSEELTEKGIDHAEQYDAYVKWLAS